MTSVVRSRTSGSNGMVQLATHQGHSQVSECRCPTGAPAARRGRGGGGGVGGGAAACCAPLERWDTMTRNMCRPRASPSSSPARQEGLRPRAARGSETGGARPAEPARGTRGAVRGRAARDGARTRCGGDRGRGARDARSGCRQAPPRVTARGAFVTQQALRAAAARTGRRASAASPAKRRASPRRTSPRRGSTLPRPWQASTALVAPVDELPRAAIIRRLTAEKAAEEAERAAQERARSAGARTLSFDVAASGLHGMDLQRERGDGAEGAEPPTRRKRCDADFAGLRPATGRRGGATDPQKALRRRLRRPPAAWHGPP
eukprot:5239137-Pleurochrysis_carterae.AAC.1